MADDPRSLFGLEGKVALVTGGSRGLGREMALGFAQAGADVVVASRNLESCEATAKEIEQLTGRTAMPYSIHMGRWDQVEPLVDAVYERFGRLDVLVNNAGVSPQYDKIVDVPEKLWDAVQNLNLKGPFRLTAVAGTRMVEAGGGSIINISSVGSIHPSAVIIPYAAAKAGLNNMTIGFAHSFGPTVRVNCIMPGGFRTDISASWDWEWYTERTKTYALGRVGEPHEIVGTALYLASDASSFTTGAVFPVDGGVPT
ncbi:SDR family oxidoreductase [Pseudonocardia halophobica]|uniref:Short-chain dehydrogenase n=1 Tax=Pseudonocardia halophobica TaxID=29401 RepID=A0A9W6L012_9PSEU|nr:glucose 1-dehydrogenase [Pseudonocardia halophobica]GLL10533.1 short-chain dehydrogenase [Pseudonocardia halophobica]